jgi:predicted NAD/FAD-dependent oxidoreductase
MVIGIVGAGLSGLIAGRELAKAGHEVMIFEKEHGIGGRLASTTIGEHNQLVDYGASFLNAKSEDFGAFIEEMTDKGLVKEWASHFGLWDGTQYMDVNPNKDHHQYYCGGENGIGGIADGLSRWVDFKEDVKVSGLTYLGGNRRVKKSWMINQTNFNVFQADAVILATPAVVAYGLLMIAQDETPVRRIIRSVDEINYDPTISLMLTYGDQELPEWKGMDCNDPVISWISNESSKYEDGETALLVKSTSQFAKENRKSDDDDIVHSMIERLSHIVGDWSLTPTSYQTHHWKYERVINSFEEDYIEMEFDDAPLALIGDYFAGGGLDGAYKSAKALADHWIETL